jgi:hypothetical protein
MLTKERLAERLRGRQYGDETTPEETRLAKESGLVIVYGASDDLIEFEGAIQEESGAYDGGSFYLTREGLIETCEDGCKYYRAALDKATELKAVWAKGEWSWQYETTIPHAKFEIFEDEEKYCVGIVFSLSDVPA